MINVEVAYALAHKQKLYNCRWPQGTHAREAAVRSGLDKEFADLDLAQSPLGIFGKSIARPEEHILTAGERIEIYRTFAADPKEVRRQRAERAHKQKQQNPRNNAGSAAGML